MTSIESFAIFLQQYPHLAYLILFLGSYFETLVGVGFFVYGELFFLAGAILAGTGVLNIWLVSLVCIIGGIAGDSSSFYIGRRYGERIAGQVFKKENRFLSAKNYEWSKRKFQQHGVRSIFLARFLGPLSWVTPFIAGTLKTKYGKFLKYNIPGVILGIGQFMVVGYLFGFAYRRFLHALGQYALIIAIVLIALAVVYVVVKVIIAARSAVR